jgi:hypothetical protein
MVEDGGGALIADFTASVGLMMCAASSGGQSSSSGGAGLTPSTTRVGHKVPTGWGSPRGWRGVERQYPVADPPSDEQLSGRLLASHGPLKSARRG